MELIHGDHAPNIIKQSQEGAAYIESVRSADKFLKFNGVVVAKFYPRVEGSCSFAVFFTVNFKWLSTKWDQLNESILRSHQSYLADKNAHDTPSPPGALRRWHLQKKAIASLTGVCSSSRIHWRVSLRRGNLSLDSSCDVAWGPK